MENVNEIQHNVEQAIKTLASIFMLENTSGEKTRIVEFGDEQFEASKQVFDLMCLAKVVCSSRQPKWFVEM